MATSSSTMPMMSIATPGPAGTTVATGQQFQPGSPVSAGNATVVMGRPVGQIGQGVDLGSGESIQPGGGPNIQPGGPIQLGNFGGGSNSIGRQTFIQGPDGRPIQVIMVDDISQIPTNAQQMYGQQQQYGQQYGQYSTNNPYGPNQNQHDLVESVYPPTILAAVTCICCFFPGGACACIAFVKCSECSQAIAQRDFQKARQKKEEAMKWIYCAWICTGVFSIIYAMRGSGGGSSSSQSQQEGGERRSLSLLVKAMRGSGSRSSSSSQQWGENGESRNLNNLVRINQSLSQRMTMQQQLAVMEGRIPISNDIPIQNQKLQGQSQRLESDSESERLLLKSRFKRNNRLSDADSESRLTISTTDKDHNNDIKSTTASESDSESKPGTKNQKEAQQDYHSDTSSISKNIDDLSNKSQQYGPGVPE